MEISAIKDGGSDAEWQMPLQISMYFLGILPYSQLPPVEKTNSKYWSDEKLLSIKFVKKKTISNLKVKKLYKSKRKAMFESLGSKIDVFLKSTVSFGRLKYWGYFEILELRKVFCQ